MGKWEINFSEAWILKGNGLASAPAFEFTPGYRLVSGKYAALFAEAPLVIGSAAQVNYANGPASYRSYFFTPSVRVQFRATKWWRPWFSGGYGPSMGIPNPGLLAAGLLKPDVMVTGATQVGGGINITPFKAGVGFRLEVRDFISRVPNIELGEKKMQQTLVPSGSVTLRF